MMLHKYFSKLINNIFYPKVSFPLKHYSYELGAELLIAELLNRAIAKEREFQSTGCESDHEFAMDLLGRAMHTAQDRWAHSEQNAGWVDHLLTPFGIGPDSPRSHPVEYSNAYFDTADILSRYINATSR